MLPRALVQEDFERRKEEYRYGKKEDGRIEGWKEGARRVVP